MKLNSFYVIPQYTFFYWGFTLPKREYPDFIKHFRLNRKTKTQSVSLIIAGKKYPAKVRIAYITTSKFPNRQVVQIFYDREHETLKALRKLFVYSYVSTIDKAKPALKELLELVHEGNNSFKVKIVSKQKTDFDDMFEIMENRELFDYYKQIKKGKERNFFINYSQSWIPVSELSKYKQRFNVIYLLYNSKKKQLYIGKANRLGDRVKRGQGRTGLDKDWDNFMFFEIAHEYNLFIDQIESFAIRSFAALLRNEVGIKPLNEKNITLTNRQLKKK